MTERFPVGTKVVDKDGQRFPGVAVVDQIQTNNPRQPVKLYRVKVLHPASGEFDDYMMHEGDLRLAPDQSPPVLGSAPFYGAVSLIDFHQDLDGQQYRCFVGAVQIVEAKAYLGFATGASEANWMAVVSGDKTTLVFPGCKITHVTEIKGDHLSQTFVSRATAVKVVE